MQNIPTTSVPCQHKLDPSLLPCIHSLKNSNSCSSATEYPKYRARPFTPGILSETGPIKCFDPCTSTSSTSSPHWWRLPYSVFQAPRFHSAFWDVSHKQANSLHLSFSLQPAVQSRTPFLSSICSPASHILSAGLFVAACPTFEHSFPD